MLAAVPHCIEARDVDTGEKTSVPLELVYTSAGGGRADEGEDVDMEEERILAGKTPCPVSASLKRARVASPSYWCGPCPAPLHLVT